MSDNIYSTEVTHIRNSVIRILAAKDMRYDFYDITNGWKLKLKGSHEITVFWNGNDSNGSPGVNCQIWHGIELMYHSQAIMLDDSDYGRFIYDAQNIQIDIARYLVTM